MAGAPATPPVVSHVPPPLSDSFRTQFAWHLAQPRERSRKTVLGYACAVAGGKFVLSYGSSLLVEGTLSHKPGFVAGGSVACALGASLFVFGALRFSRAVARIDRRAALLLKSCSLIGGAGLMASYGLHGAVASNTLANPFAVDMAARTLDYMSFTIMVCSFTGFFVSSQAVYGDVLGEPARKNTGALMLGTGLFAAKLIPAPANPSSAAAFGLLLANSVISFYELFGLSLVFSSVRPLWFHPPHSPVPMASIGEQNV